MKLPRGFGKEVAEAGAFKQGRRHIRNIPVTNKCETCGEEEKDHLFNSDGDYDHCPNGDGQFFPNDLNAYTKCGNFSGSDIFVDAALHSDCNDCRAAVGIASTTDKGCAAREPLAPYEPRPHEDAETALADAVRRRDGR